MYHSRSLASHSLHFVIAVYSSILQQSPTFLAALVLFKMEVDELVNIAFGRDKQLLRDVDAVFVKIVNANEKMSE